MDQGGGHKVGRWDLYILITFPVYFMAHLSFFLILQPDLQTQPRHDKISDDQIWAVAQNRRPRFHHEAGVWRSEHNQMSNL